MIIKVIAALVIVWCSIYLTIRCSKLDSLVNQLKLDIKFKDAHIKQQQEKINNILLEVKDLENELTVVYGKARVHPEEKRSEILMLRAKWLKMREIAERVWLSKSTISKYLKIWDSETRWSQKYPRPVMPKNKSLFQ